MIYYVIDELVLTTTIARNGSKTAFIISFLCKRIGKLIDTIILEYDINNSIIKESLIDLNNPNTYFVDEDMLYIVIEEKFELNDGSIYYNREIIYNNEINPIIIIF